METASPITDPASVLIGLGALVALAASIYWYRVFRALDRNPSRLPGRTLGGAALLTAIVLALVAAGYLLGRFTGRF